MIEPIIVTLFPAFFLIVLFGGGELFRRKNIDMGGNPPIGKWQFSLSKYSIMILWAVMVLHAWNIRFLPLQVPVLLKLTALCLWVLGFSLLFTGRFGLGNSFRIGSPQEKTSLRTNGLFKFSRNPMYVGVYTTILASVLYTLNPFVLFIGIFVVAVHHKIVLAEEQHMLKVFSKQYEEYCCRVRRYI
jgi:protein-S-isoprenylcysteine O-methyltransferase Ste14